MHLLRVMMMMMMMDRADDLLVDNDEADDDSIVSQKKSFETYHGGKKDNRPDLNCSTFWAGGFLHANNNLLPHFK
jgi:hypothetical protein